MIIITDASFKAPHSGTLSIFVGDIAKKKHVKAKSSVHAELLSIKMALDYLVAKNIKGATIINDNKPVVDHLNGKVKMCDQLIKIADQTKALMEQTETKIEWRSRKETVIPDMVCQGKAKNTKFKTLSLPQLDLLSPTMESTVIKLGEEVGELNRCVGKWRGMSGEKKKKTESAVLREVAKELLDVAQTCITMMFVLEGKHNVSIDSVLKEHYNKLRQKGYMS